MSVKQGGNTIAGGIPANTLNYDNISNCITEIPQDIKLELNNGTLTLKAGSKVYVPNGVGVFDVITLTADETGTQTTNDTRLYFYNGSYIEKFPVAQCYSGNTAPSGQTYMFWYDTTNNVVKKTSDSGSTWESGWSLPFCIATASSGALTSIDQVFNGFGYIGSTVFALPNVKGLIPNGRNKDGTLKNIEYENTIVRLRTFTWDISGSGQFLALTTTGMASSGTNVPFYQQEDMPPNRTYAFWYKPSENIMYTTGSGTTWYKTDLMVAGNIIGDTTGKISSLQTKKPFHAVDYDDFNELKQVVNAKIQLVTSLPTTREPDVLYVIAES